MSLFPRLARAEHENLLFFQHRDSGLKGVLAIHDTSLGPAVGGVRCWNYETEGQLVRDALCLSESASLSAALFGCDAGGGKAILWANPEDKNEAMLRAFGIFLQGLGGRFIASADLGTTSQDMDLISKETTFVTGHIKGQTNEGDHSRITARGVLLGMKAAAKVNFGSASLKGRKIAIQGIGKVGMALLELLVLEGAQLYISDIFFERVKNAKDKFFGVEMVSPDEIQFLPVDIFAPCAMGDLFTKPSIEKLRCKIIAGPAPNQLPNDQAAADLAESGILYIPEFLLNSGDIIMVNAEIYGIPTSNCQKVVERVYCLVENLLVKAKSTNRLPQQLAKEWALERVRSIRTLKKLYRPAH